MKAFSVDFVGSLALFKKNDANDMVHISYNFIHKPMLLGLFGAILGLSGYSKSGKGKFPVFYQKLKNLKLAIKPYYNKPLKKVITGFNNASGLASDKSGEGRTWQIREQVLVGEPEIRYRVFVLMDENIEELIKLQSMLKNYKTTYPLYFGKNEFFAHYENYQEYKIEEIKISPEKIVFNSLVIDDNFEEKEFDFDDFDPFDVSANNEYSIYENLPIDFDEYGFYKKEILRLTNKALSLRYDDDFYKLKNKKKEYNVQFI